ARQRRSFVVAKKSTNPLLSTRSGTARRKRAVADRSISPSADLPALARDAELTRGADAAARDLVAAAVRGSPALDALVLAALRLAHVRRALATDAGFTGRALRALDLAAALIAGRAAFDALVVAGLRRARFRAA